jgi:hypothetical protein
MPAALIDLQLVHPGTTAQYTQARLHRAVSCVVAPLLTLFLTALRIFDWVSAALGHDSVLPNWYALASANTHHCIAAVRLSPNSVFLLD